MATNRSGHRPGGGIASNKITERPVITGQRGRQYHQSGVSQVGASVGNHATNTRGSTDYRGDAVRGALRPPGTPGAVPLGNALATNVGKGGPGTGRNLYGQGGSQGTYGGTNSGNPRPQGRDILSEFGPESKR